MITLVTDANVPSTARIKGLRALAQCGHIAIYNQADWSLLLDMARQIQQEEPFGQQPDVKILTHLFDGGSLENCVPDPKPGSGTDS